MKKISIFILALFLMFALVLCTEKAKTSDEAISSDSTIAKTDSVKTTLTIEEEVLAENILSIESKNLFIADGNWLDRNCFPPRTYSFTTDKAFLSSKQSRKIPPAYNLKGDTLLVFYKRDSAERYKIVSLTNLKMSLQPLQLKGNFIDNCTAKDEILVYRDEVVNAIQPKKIAGSWGNGEGLILKKDGTFEYDAPPACSASGSWAIANGKLALTFTADGCLNDLIENINDIVLTNFTLYIKTQSQGEDKYRALYRQDHY